MKKSILTISIIALSTGVFAQQKQTVSKPTPAPFTVHFKQQDLQFQVDTYKLLSKTIHGLKMDALVRDTADMRIGQLFNLIQVRYREAFVADSVAKTKKK